MIPVPKALLMSQIIGSPKPAEDWLKTPADTAHYLSQGRWQRAKHLEFLSNEIARIKQQPVYLIINMPPRHGKSELISRWTPVWYLKRWPHKRIILASYQQGFAADWGGVVKNTLIENETELKLSLATDTRAKAQWQIKGYGGGMLATGVMGAITGRGGDLLLIDDPIKSQKEALSPTYRNSIIEWYKSTFRTRAQPDASIILLMTRWHEDDLAGWLLEEAANPESDVPSDPWRVINLPAIAESNDPLDRAEGEALWPEMYPLDSLFRIKQAVGSYWWSAEYQGFPRPEGGGIIKEEWFGYFDYTPQTSKYRNVIQVWDTAYEQGSEASRSACITLAEGEHLDVLDVWAGRPAFPDLCRMVKSKYEQYQPARVFVEAKASGKSLIQQLRVDTTIPLIPITDNDDKATRLHSVSGMVESGKVRLKARASWLGEFLHEVCGFPAVEHDDITDTFSHALRVLSRSSTRKAYAGTYITGRKENR